MVAGTLRSSISSAKRMTTYSGKAHPGWLLPALRFPVFDRNSPTSVLPAVFAIESPKMNAIGAGPKIISPSHVGHNFYLRLSIETTAFERGPDFIMIAKE